MPPCVMQIAWCTPSADRAYRRLTPPAASKRRGQGQRPTHGIKKKSFSFKCFLCFSLKMWKNYISCAISPHFKRTSICVFFLPATCCNRISYNIRQTTSDETLFLFVTVGLHLFHVCFFPFIMILLCQHTKEKTIRQFRWLGGCGATKNGSNCRLSRHTRARYRLELRGDRNKKKTVGMFFSHLLLFDSEWTESIWRRGGGNKSLHSFESSTNL